MKNILSSFLILWSFSLTAGLPPNVIKGQDDTVYKGALKLEVPSSQAVNTGSSILVDTGNDDILIDGSMEASGVAAWTCTVGTCTKTSVAGEFSPPGKQALKVALSAQAMNVSQSVSTGTGALTQYVIGTKYRVPATMADFQICTLIAGAEKTCAPSANLILDDTYHSIEIPEVITPGSTVGIKFKTTTAYTANAFFDKAYIKQGLGSQSLQLDNVYSAQVVTTSGAVSNLSKVGWVSCTAANPTVCTFASGIFTLAPNCWTTETTNAVAASIGLSSVTATSLTASSFNTTTGALTASVPFTLSCQKQGNDYLSSSSAVYSSSNALTQSSTIIQTATFGNADITGALTTNVGSGCYSYNAGTGVYTALKNCDISMSFSESTPGAASVEALISKNAGAIILAADTTVAATGAKASAQSNFSVVAGDTFKCTNNSTNNTDRQWITVVARPSSNQIVGSFAGYTNVPGYQGNVAQFKVNYGTTAFGTACSANPCSYFDSKSTDAVSMGWTSAGLMTLNFARTYTNISCTGNAMGAAGATVDPAHGENVNSLTITTRNSTTGAVQNTWGTLDCTGTY